MTCGSLSIDTGRCAPDSVACGNGSAFDAGLLSMVGSDASLHVCAPKLADHHRAAFGCRGALASGQSERSSDSKNPDHIHPLDLHCPFNLSGPELQLWRQCRAADRRV